MAPGKDYDKFEAERSERLKEKGPLVCKFRHNIYVTDSAAEVEERVDSGFPREKIVLTNRLECDEVDGCEGSKSFWAFDSLRKAFAKLAENKYQLEMTFMPCFCRACRQWEEVKLWEQKHEQPFQGPLPRPCLFKADISSDILPERPAGLARTAKHLFRRMMGKMTVKPHIVVPDEELYDFISILKPNASPTDRDPFLRCGYTLKNLCRSRTLTLGSGKRECIKNLMQYLEKKSMLPVGAEWPQPWIQAPPAAPVVPQAAAAAPVIQAQVAIAAIAAADGNGDDDDDDATNN